METFEAEAAWLLLVQPENFPFEVKSINVDERTIKLVNSLTVKDLIKRSKSQLYYNLKAELGLTDEKVPGPFLCSLLRKEEEIYGALCLGRFESDKFFSAGDLKLADILSTQAAFSLENYRLSKEKEEKERIRKIFGSYLNPHILDDLLEKDNSLLYEVKKKKVAILFSDVRDFTTISEMLNPEELAKLLNEYYSLMSSAIFDFKGTLMQYIGDGIMAMWGAPVNDENACMNALRASIKMLKNLEIINEEKSKEKKFEKIITKLHRDNLFRMGVGIHFDDVVVGYVGTEMKMQYTAIGDGVNIAARLEKMNKEYSTELLITDAVYKKTGDNIEVKHLGVTPCRGRDPVDIYQVLSLNDKKEK
jgi:class 3 adenylate cyclase